MINGGLITDSNPMLNKGGIYFDNDKEWIQVSGGVMNFNQFSEDGTDLLKIFENIITNQVGTDKCENDVPCKKLLVKFLGTKGYVVFGITSVSKGKTSIPSVNTNEIPDPDLIEFGGIPSFNDVYRISYNVLDSRPVVIYEEEPVAEEEKKPKVYKDKKLIIPLPNG